MEVKVKIKRNYKPKSTLAVLINYKSGLQRLVKFIYPDDWDIDQLDFHINLHSEFNVRNVRFSEDISMMRMKDNLEEIKKLGYRVISLTQTYGYILRKDGKFLSYSLARYSYEGGINFTYNYKPSRSQGMGSVQGDYDFGYHEFSNEMIDKMMDHPKLYGKVEHYKDFNEYRQLNAGREKSLEKII
nr:MAG TPA: GTP Cyclohydrolase I [Bacteriophage sp.]